MRRALTFGLILSILGALAGACPSQAAESLAASSDDGTISLVSDTDRATPGQEFHLGLLFRLAPGWHIYWRNPGSAGTPPTLTLHTAHPVQTTPVAWPAPAALREDGLTSYGYTGQVLLPVGVTPSAGPVSLDAEASWLSCKQICVPHAAHFHLDLPQGVPAPSAQAPLFAAALARMPLPSAFAARIAPDGTLHLDGGGLTRSRISTAQFFADSPDQIDPDAPQTLGFTPSGLTLFLKPGPGFLPGHDLDGVIELAGQDGTAAALRLAAQPGGAPRATPLHAPRLILAALLGGLLLNLMPCVFPVLAMKALALTRLSGADQRAVRAQALFYAAGILAAFAALGAGLMLLRAGGAAIGWGFQFQSPVFVAVMSWLLFLIGLNLSGVYEIGTAWAGAGQTLASSGGAIGSFATGLLAVVVATPCTAPFMGAAIAGALAAPPATGLLIFLALGLGLATPPLLLAALPRLAWRLPRPGAWMALVKGLLAFPLYGGALWLLWVISQQAGPGGVLATGTGLLLTGFAAWALGTAQASPALRRIGLAAAAVTALCPAILLPGLARPAPAAPDHPADAETFTPARLATLRDAGQPVFVNITAAWCITCLVNELALSSNPVQSAFARHHVAYLKGDWTNQNPVLTAFLQAHHRTGVPLYLFYPPHAAPLTLPQILTPGSILALLEP